MSSMNTASSSNSRNFDPTAIPPRWLTCPRKSSIIVDRFIAFKTPLDDRYKEKLEVGQSWTCNMLIGSVRGGQKKLGLVIDLTNTDRFYKSEVEFGGKGIRYEKIRCRGHGETPNDEQTQHFIDVCNEFIGTNPNDIIGVHCTHGFNRTGFLICAYLCRELDMSIDAAIVQFAQNREPGIYKQDYLNELMQKFGDDSSAPIPAPVRPDWCLTNSDDEDEPNERLTTANSSNKRPRPGSSNAEESTKRFREEPRVISDPQFAVNLPGVTGICNQSSALNLQLKCQRLCEWNRRGFPGSQPVSMDYKNYALIVQSPYMVSWKADGTRYLLLIEDERKVYMFDRDNTVFEISHVRFPKDPDCTIHLKDTLVDGELVLDNVNGVKVPRFLIYDIITFDGENVTTKPLRERLKLIRDSIIEVRNRAIIKGLIDKTIEPFSIRNKDFYELSAVSKLTGSAFLSTVPHEVDGLIFQPEVDPYTPGRCPRVLKWKEDNTIDFRLKIFMEKDKMGQLPETKACLFVNGMSSPFAFMRYSANLRQYDNKIIECSYQNREWHFHRQRTDKSFPNAKETAFGAIDALTKPISRKILCDLIQNHARNNTQTVTSQPIT